MSAPDAERGRVASINRGRVNTLATPRGVRSSAIDKQPVEEPVAVGALGLEGDEQADHRYHGGLDKAVYLYALEDLAWWTTELGRPIVAGFIGENITTEGIALNDLRAGDRLTVGSAALAVTIPRVPCFKLAARVGVGGFEKRFAQANRTGVYGSVVRPGVIAVNDPIVIARMRREGPTIRDEAASMFGLDTR